MPGYILDENATIACPHGGRSIVRATASAKAGGGRMLTVRDVATVSGCAFNVSGAPSPCLRVDWRNPARKVTASGAAVLLSDSIGLCVNAGGAPQGVAQISGYQTKVSAR